MRARFRFVSVLWALSAATGCGPELFASRPDARAQEIINGALDDVHDAVVFVAMT